MKLIDTSVQPEPGTWKYKLCEWFCDHVNFCHGVFYTPKKISETEEIFIDKPDNSLYDWFYKYWLFPFKQTDCVCCNTVRGLLYGAIIGYILGRLL